MKTLVCLTLAVSALASPALSFAQLAPSPRDPRAGPRRARPS